MSHADELKGWIRDSEERFISYKKMLEDMHRDKVAFPPNEEFTAWFKEHLREMKNTEEECLKKLIEERTYPGLTPSRTNSIISSFKKKQ